MKKNDIIELYIQDVGADGAGIGRAFGLAFFVKDAVIGDRVRAKVTKLKKNYGYARLIEILEPSSFRVDPPCPIHRSCGGCQIQALSYEKQLEFKQNKVRSDLKRIGGFEETHLEPIEGMADPWRFRNKAQFPVGKDKEGHIVTGFYAGRTHQIIPAEDCLTGSSANSRILDAVKGVMERYRIEPYDEGTGLGVIRHILIRCGFNTGQIMVCFVINADTLPHQRDLTDALSKIEGVTSICVSVNKKRTNVIMGESAKAIWGKPYITDTIGDIKYQISALSFYQVNPVQTEKIYKKVLEYAFEGGAKDEKGHEGPDSPKLPADATDGAKGKVVWDLYCGIGTISLFLARRAKKVYGIEIIPQAVEDAKRNAAINGIENAEFFCGKAEEILPGSYERLSKSPGGAFAENGSADEGPKDPVIARPDVIVVDPPRKGCDKTLLDTILKMRPERIVYVSCDPATLARDLKILCEGGYELEKVKPFDMFCHSVHVETAVSLSIRI